MSANSNIHLLDIGVAPGRPDPAGGAVVRAAARHFGLALETVRERRLIYIEGPLEAADREAIAAGLTDPVLEVFDWNRPPNADFDCAIRVGYKPGVTDPVAISVRSCLADLLGRKKAAALQGVYTAREFWIYAPGLTREDMERLARGYLANGLIETVQIFSRNDWLEDSGRLTVPRMPVTPVPDPQDFDLNLEDEELMELSRERLWALSLEEMKAVRDHFADPDRIQDRLNVGLGIQPTDVEMELIAQTWSEHCKHKIFAANVSYWDTITGEDLNIPSLFKTFIRDTTMSIGKRVDWLVKVFDDNAGVIRFNDRVHLSFKVETHNSPSALDPYGGAITGIVGVNRDSMGTGLGGDLLANVWGYCFARPDFTGTVPEGLMHPRRIRDGVHKGVIDGGNQSGVPYARGWEYFDARYLGKPLVYCGTLGTVPVHVAGQPGHKKRALPDDVIVMVGGKIGKDGIHGATFSSAALEDASPAQAVQIGDPITQKKMDDFLREARGLGLYRSITDNGAGGLGSSIGEMAREAGGATIELGKAPLKYPGLAAWEILLSESQERMTLAVPKEKFADLAALAALREVEVTGLGMFNASGVIRANHQGQCVALLSMDFLHGGCPTMNLHAEWTPPRIETAPLPEDRELRRTLLDLLAQPSLSSNEEKARQYDHEVKGLSVIKPWIGVRGDVPSDATVMRVEHGSNEGVALADAVHPSYGDLDTYHMATASVDEAVRRCIAAGARPDWIAGLDNFCWPDPLPGAKNPDAEYKLAQLVRACKGLRDACEAYDVPLVSGKDSMKNDSWRGGVKISIPPTLLISVMAKMDDVRKAVTLDPKMPGDEVFILGLTRDELGGSQLAVMQAAGKDNLLAVGGKVPVTDFKASREINGRLAQAIRDGLVRSAVVVSKGGLGLALARMAMASQLGLKVELDWIPCDAALDATRLLFSESTGRFVVTASKAQANELTQRFQGLPFGRVGTVANDGKLTVTFGVQPVGRWSIDELGTVFKKTLGEDTA